ncbi:hypothetical protein ACJW30_06G053200 [Castanea mollissima]
MLLVLCPFFHSSHAARDTISQGQSITITETIVSAGAKFELGFFRPGNSTYQYVGIWFKKVSKQIVTWVANRNYQIVSSSAVLTISNDGNLVIVDGQLSYSVSNMSSNGNASATLLDSGNLVLRDENSNILWQSFDFPSHTFLPGMKLGYKNNSGKSWSFVSWRNLSDPSPGVFSLELDHKGITQFIITRKPEGLYWTSGPWDGKIFSFLPEVGANYIYNFSYTSNEEETYFTYDLYDPSIVSMLVMDVSGQLQQLTWWESTQQWNLIWAQPLTQCEVYAFCGAFGLCNQQVLPFCSCIRGFEPRSSGNWELKDYSAGCARKTPLQCENHNQTTGDPDEFVMLSNVQLPVNPESFGSRSIEECKSACLNNCSCTGYALNDYRCSIWIGDLINLRQLADYNSSARDLYVKVPASVLNPKRSKRQLWIILVLAVSLTAISSAAIIWWMWVRKLKRKGEDLISFDFNKKSTQQGLVLKKGAEKGRNKEMELPLFSFSSVSAATNNFTASNKLGEGGFGPVYKGSLLNGQLVAVKRLSRKSGQGWEELKNEAVLIAKLQHKNLVKLLGCCVEGDEKILIYEYLPNKSLDNFLFDPVAHGVIDWTTRIHIIEGIVQGLLYLHQYSRLQIIHRDLKASNILLDKDMNPKISDFGMARIFCGNGSQATNRIVGTYGYMSPEYALEGLFSIKSDVFSFGVLLLEILCGKKNTGFYHSDSLNLIGYAWDLWKSNRALELMDPILGDTPPANVLLGYINIALLCVQESAADRPTMPDVVSMFNKEIALLPSPKRPAFSFVRGVENLGSSNRKPEICSVNDMTVSILKAR